MGSEYQGWFRSWTQLKDQFDNQFLESMKSAFSTLVKVLLINYVNVGYTYVNVGVTYVNTVPRKARAED